MEALFFLFFSSMLNGLTGVIRESVFNKYEEMAERHHYERKSLSIILCGFSGYTFSFVVMPVTFCTIYKIFDLDPIYDIEKGIGTFFSTPTIAITTLTWFLIGGIYELSNYQLLSKGGAVVSFICAKAVFPITAVLAATNNWPIIGREELPPVQIVSLVLVLVGVAIYKKGQEAPNVA